MAERNFDNPEILGRKKRFVVGSFAPNGASALVAADTRTSGGVTSIARTSTGLFTITLMDRYGSLLAAVGNLQLASGDDKSVQFGTYTAASKTITLRIWDNSGAAETDVAANANNRVNFCLVFDDAVTQ